ncbi:ribonuclease P protein component [Microbacterium halophytorum]|uniref:ribonuclease P protein component n=1 Tax=Microbacterium halophytorum TaxID=2067568 RepID=UPI000CFC5044|nr:ribonuclease P protein component [Microbacterium halophytorum]
MLAKANRLTRGAEYRHVSRRGVRGAGPHLVTHIVLTGEEREPRFGFIVTKAVGNAVVRNTVRRRLKAICAEALPDVPKGADVVIRALPSSSGAAFAELRSQVRRGLKRRGALAARERETA